MFTPTGIDQANGRLVQFGTMPEWGAILSALRERRRETTNYAERCTMNSRATKHRAKRFGIVRRSA